MSSYATYAIVSSGEYLDGFSAQQVQQDFARLFKLSDDVAATVLGGERTLKKGLDKDRAALFQQRLKAIGLRVKVKPETPAVAAVLDDARSKSRSSKAHSVEKSPLDNASENAQAEPRSEAAPISYEQAYEQEEALYEQARFKPLSLVAAIIVAVAAALVWFFLAVAFKHEWAWLAWIIGGLVGAAAFTLKAQDTVTASLCAVLVVVAVISGKYLAASSWQSHIIDQMRSAYQTPELREVYNRELENARRLSSEVVDDASLRAFIVGYGYSAAVNIKELSEQDVVTFKTETRPRLEKMARGELPFEDWGMASFGRPDEMVSLWNLMRNSLGWMDAVYMLLGALTAFAIVYLRRFLRLLPFFG